jgi:hypothetical protein
MTKQVIQSASPDNLGQLTKIPELTNSDTVQLLVTNSLTARTYHFLDDGSIVIIAMNRNPIRLIPPSGSQFAWDLRHFLQQIDAAEAALIDAALASTLSQ